jgi:hypothetical protein
VDAGTGGGGGTCTIGKADWIRAAWAAAASTGSRTVREAAAASTGSGTAREAAGDAVTTGGADGTTGSGSM